MDRMLDRVDLTHNVRTLFEDAKTAKILLASPVVYDANMYDNKLRVRTPNSLGTYRDTQSEEQSARRRRTLLGDKSVTIPSFPKVLDGKGAESITLQE